MKDKLPGKKWLAAARVARAARIKRDALTDMAKKIGTTSTTEFVRTMLPLERDLNTAIDAWIAAGGDE